MMAEVEKHNSSESCWLAIDGTVYVAHLHLHLHCHPPRLAFWPHLAAL
jgi:cytochrome b involved in lipid metabolism